MNAQATNRQWRVIERPTGMVGLEHFAYREEPAPAPQQGEVLVRTVYVSFDPAMRAFRATWRHNRLARSCAPAPSAR